MATSVIVGDALQMNTLQKIECPAAVEAGVEECFARVWGVGVRAE